MGETIVPVAAKYAVLALGGFTLVWERHTEFAQLHPARPRPVRRPFDPARFEPLLAPIMAGMPGEIVRATQIALVARRSRRSDAGQRWRDGSSDEATVSAMLRTATRGSSRTSGSTPMAIGRLLVLDRDLAGDEPAQLVQRLQELGNYRNMALLGLPLAQRLTPEVTELESRLAVLTQAVSERTAEDDELLDELTFLSAELARLMSRDPLPDERDARLCADQHRPAGEPARSARCAGSRRSPISPSGG